MNPAAHSRSDTIEAGGCAPAVIVETPLRVNFVCVNVDGYYSMDYVAILHDSILRNLSRTDHEIAFWCVTDRPDELPPGVNHIPADPRLRGWWIKVQLFSPDMPWKEGERIHYFDLDVAITGRLEDFVDAKGIIDDWHWTGARNTSVMSWDHGEHRGAWDHFDLKFLDWDPGPVIPKKWLPSHAKNAGDMEFLMYATQQGWDADPWELYPKAWFPSYRTCHAWPSEGSKAVIFHGQPKPAAVTEGWVPNVWKIGGFTSFPAFKGANTSEDHRMANVRSACAREHIPWFTGFRDEGASCVIVAGGPSMLDYISDIRWHARQPKTRIVTVNNAWRTMVERGVIPDVHIMLDAREENAEFVKGAPKAMRFVIASQCHPAVFDVLEAQGNEIAIWHAGLGDNEAVLEILKPWWDEGPKQKPTLLIPGGSTVGLRALWLATYSGFRRIHVFGMDSSYDVDGAHHAYAQNLNDGETVLEVVRGDKRYQCAPWMVRQANEFTDTWHDLRRYAEPDGRPSPVTIHVKGHGLIPDIAAELRAAEREKA